MIWSESTRSSIVSHCRVLPVGMRKTELGRTGIWVEWQALHVLHVLLCSLLVDEVCQGCRNIQVLRALLVKVLISEIWGKKKKKKEDQFSTVSRKQMDCKHGWLKLSYMWAVALLRWASQRFLEWRVYCCCRLCLWTLAVAAGHFWHVGVWRSQGCDQNHFPVK